MNGNNISSDSVQKYIGDLHRCNKEYLAINNAAKRAESQESATIGITLWFEDEYSTTLKLPKESVATFLKRMSDMAEQHVDDVLRMQQYNKYDINTCDSAAADSPMSPELRAAIDRGSDSVINSLRLMKETK